MLEGLILIPAYNEEKNIGEVLRNIKKLNIDIDILVIDDGSRDNTRNEVLKEKVDVISHIFNLGYGGALQTGFKYAAEMRYKYVIQFDADGQHIPEYIIPMIKEIDSSNADIVIGSRFLNQSPFKAGLLKGILIKFLQLIIRISTGNKITDHTSGFKGLSQRTYEYYSFSENFPSDYPDADILIKMLRLNYSVKEFPIEIRQRNFGESMHSGLKPIVYMLKVILSILIVLLGKRAGRGE